MLRLNRLRLQYFNIKIMIKMYASADVRQRCQMQILIARKSLFWRFENRLKNFQRDRQTIFCEFLAILSLIWLEEFSERHITLPLVQLYKQFKRTYHRFRMYVLSETDFELSCFGSIQNDLTRSPFHYVRAS